MRSNLPTMSRIALAAGVIGVALVLVSALADPIGIGGSSGFGWKQWVGVAVGATLVVAAIVLGTRASRSSE
jgi:hypothetical protein